MVLMKLLKASNSRFAHPYKNVFPNGGLHWCTSLDPPHLPFCYDKSYIIQDSGLREKFHINDLAKTALLIHLQFHTE